MSQILNYLGTVLAAINWKEDAKYTAVLARQLEHLKTKVYDVIYPQFKARQLIPVSNEADPGAETITYQQWDSFGMATWISNYGDDLPLVDALTEDFTSKIKGMGVAYQYSVQDLRRSALSGTSLPEKKARATRRFIEQKIEDVAATGEAVLNILGIANNPNVALITPTTGTWSTATAAEMIADLDKLVFSIILLTAETYPPTRIVLPLALYNIIARKRLSTTGDTSHTVLQDYIDSSPSVTEIIPWNKLATANAAGTGPRIIAYTPDPDVLSLEIPQEYEQFPPQAKNLAFVVNTHARTAGVLMPLPMAVAYMDGC